MINVSGKKIYIDANTFQNNQTIVNVDLCNKAWVNNSMSIAFYNCPNLVSVTGFNENITTLYSTFYYCSNLTSVPTIPNSVTNMYSTFGACSNLVNVPQIPPSVTNMVQTFRYMSLLNTTPVIPNSVTNIKGCFESCANLPECPNIPDSVTDMNRTFYGCRRILYGKLSNNVTNLVNAYASCYNMLSVQNIPTSVTNMVYTFRSCTHLSGNIYIKSENVSNAFNCFYGTTLRKNVYIPFTYENGVNTLTYNSFISSGYDTLGTINGVYLKDCVVDLSDWTYTNNSGVVTLTGYIGSDMNIVLPEVI